VMAAGDVVLFRWNADAAAKHIGILSAPDHFIHAYEQAGVIESPLVPAWRRRIAWVFRWGAEAELTS
jgi:NlpC/P60 family putative phage cell wall peptidase